MAFPFPLNSAESDQRRVVITGAGILTSMGWGWRENADGFRQGRIATRPITLFDTSRQRVGIAGELTLPEPLPRNSLTTREAARLDRATAMLLHSASEAWQQAGWDSTVNSNPLPLCLGTSAGAMELGESYYRNARDQAARRSGRVEQVFNYQTHRQATHLADAMDFSGPVTIIANACASGANAIGHAVSLIRCGETDRAFAGGYDALSQMVFAGFDSLQALTTQPVSRPFDAHRDGLTLGEGAAMLALESLASARARGAEILAEIVGYGASTDSHHLTQPHPEGDAALRSMEAACREAGLRPGDIDYLNSHGTGTPLNDIAEGRAIQRWAGGAVEKIRVSSTKASIGHLLGGAGAVETVIALMALREDFLPPTTTVETPDEVCTFDLVREPRDAPVRRVLTNSFGFGGANATLILAEFDEGRRFSGASLPKTNPIRIAGWGAVSPAGWGMSAMNAAIVNAGADWGEAEIFSREGCPWPVSHRRVPPPVEKLPFLRDPRLRRTSPVARFCVGAALEAIGEERAVEIREGRLRLGVVFCLVNGCVNYSSRFYGEVLDHPSLASPIVFPETVYNAPASHLSALLGSHGINYTLVGDSAQFLSGLEIAARWLAEDRCDGVVVAGGEEFDWLSAEAVQMFAPGTIFSEGAGALYLDQSDAANSITLQRLLDPELYTHRLSKQEAAQKVASALTQQGQVADSTLLSRASGQPKTDAAENAAWQSFPGEQIAIGKILGEGMGAAVAWQCAMAAQRLADGESAVIISAIGENEQAGGAIFGRETSSNLKD